VDITANCPLARALADRLRLSREELTGRWLERISARVALDPNRVFPTDELLDHVPLLVDGIADYIEDPAREVSGEMPVVAKAMELGGLRHAQGFDVHEIQKEYELLGSILFAFLARTVDEIEQPCARSELLVCAQRLFRAIAVIQQASTNQFLQQAAEQVREREGRLRAFSRTVSHELKNRLGAIHGAYSLLREPWVEAGQRERLMSMIGENTAGMQDVLEDLLSLSRLDNTPRQQQRNVRLSKAAAEAVRELRESARARGVTVRLAHDLPGLGAD